MDAAFRRDVRAHSDRYESLTFAAVLREDSDSFQGKEGASLDGYVRAANDILFNLEVTIEHVERAYEE